MVYGSRGGVSDSSGTPFSQAHRRKHGFASVAALFAHVLEVDLQGLHHVAAAAALPAAMTPGYRVASRNTPICKALASWHVWPCLGNRRRSCVESITLPRRVLDLLLVLPLKAHNRVCS